MRKGPDGFQKRKSFWQGLTWFILGPLDQYFTNEGHFSAKVSEIKEINYVLQPGIQRQGPFLFKKAVSD